jgi:hypothetical protein
MQWMIDAVPWDGFHLDIDYRHAASRNDGLRTLSMDMSRVQRTCNSSGVSHGIIVWGCDESSTDTWARSARDLLAAIQDTVHRGEMIWPHRLIVQSWSANGTGAESHAANTSSRRSANIVGTAQGRTRRALITRNSQAASSSARRVYEPPS